VRPLKLQRRFSITQPSTSVFSDPSTDTIILLCLLQIGKMVDNLETEKNSFSVVSFPIDNSVEAVPTKWLSEDRQFCPWPKKAGNSVNFRKLLQDSSSSPGLNWEQFQINVIKEYGKSVEHLIFSSLHGLISI
jgi:hypothetical protein